MSLSSKTKKIFVYIGSNNGDKSGTRHLVKHLLNEVQKRSTNNIEILFHMGSDTTIKECRGCLTCIKQGTCPLDKTDDMELLKSEILQSDIVILGSPVYFHDVSSNFKKLIDRLSYWSHMMYLTGKAGIAVATSAGNGLCCVTDYIHKFFNYTGVYNLFSLSCPSYSLQVMLENHMLEQLQPQIEIYADQIQYFLSTENQIQIEIEKESIFQFYKKQALSNKKYIDDFYEIRYWFDRGIIEFESFQQYFQSIRINT